MRLMGRKITETGKTGFVLRTGLLLLLMTAALLTGRSPLYAEDSYRNYVLACPFFTITDEMSLSGLLAAVREGQAPGREIRSV